jgi:FlaA1/EpsC-like NDP-sugar epimerase
MTQQLKNNFMQAAFGTIIWIALISQFTHLQPSDTIPFHYLWNLIGIGVLAGAVFGIIYPFLWNYSTFKSATNVILSTLANLSFQILGVWLYSQEIFEAVIKPYWIIFATLTLLGHIATFYFYRKHENKKMATELNQLQP